MQYTHVGIGAGRTRLTRVLGYMLMLPLAVRRRPADVVVEDFFAPVSSIAAPLWTGRPTLGMVQWLNAREKAAQYKVPVHLVERFGVRRHHRVVAVSEGIAAQLRTVNPELTVDVIGNGVPAAAFDAERARATTRLRRTPGNRAEGPRPPAPRVGARVRAGPGHVGDRGNRTGRAVAACAGG